MTKSIEKLWLRYFWKPTSAEKSVIRSWLLWGTTSASSPVSRRSTVTRRPGLGLPEQELGASHPPRSSPQAGPQANHVTSLQSGRRGMRMPGSPQHVGWTETEGLKGKGKSRLRGFSGGKGYWWKWGKRITLQYHIPVGVKISTPGVLGGCTGQPEEWPFPERSLLGTWAIIFLEFR